MNPYTTDFYKKRHERTRHAADKILSIVFEALPDVCSAIDVGCGVGTWLSVLTLRGVNDVCGIDGPWIEKELLEIPRDCFLELQLSQPIELPRRYDLAISLEVAEHLPPESAATFVESLVKLSDSILFSAAIPYQGGKGHLNEQWQDYWVDLFSAHNYSPADVIRGRIWNDSQIPYWYRQNTLLFINSLHLPQQAATSTKTCSSGPYSIVHPDLYLAGIAATQSFKGSLRSTKSAFFRALRKYWFA